MFHNHVQEVRNILLFGCHGRDHQILLETRVDPASIDVVIVVTVTWERIEQVLFEYWLRHRPWFMKLWELLSWICIRLVYLLDLLLLHKALEKSGLLVDLDSIKAEWKHVRVSILFDKCRVEVFVKLIEFFFVAVQTIEQAHLNFGIPCFHMTLEFFNTALCQPTITAWCWQEEVRIERDALLQPFHWLALTHKAIRVVLQVVRPLNLQLSSVQVCVALAEGLRIGLQRLAKLLLNLASLDCVCRTVRWLYTERIDML